MRHDTVRNGRAAFVAAALLFISAGCTAPFSEFQGARMSGKGNGDLTASYSGVIVSGEEIQDQFGLQGAYGVTDDLDLRVRYERIGVKDWDVGPFNALAFGPKIALNRDRAAIYVPVGFGFGEDMETADTWELHPTLLLTQPISTVLEVNLSIKGLLSLAENGPDPRLAFNVGFGIGPDDSRVILRPEAGLMVFTDGGDPFYHVGLGLSFASTDKRRSDLLGK